jgi:hypothetical protein
MADDFDFDIPETNRIGALMRELFDDAPATKRSAKNGAEQRIAKGKKRAKHRGGVRLAAFSVGKFSDGVNWRNAQGFSSPLKAVGGPAGGKRIGGLTVTAFAQGANWRNALDGPQLIVGAAAAAPVDPNAGPPETLDDFFGDMKWE